MSARPTCITAWFWPTHERWFDEGIRRSLNRMKDAGFTHVNWNCDAGCAYIYAPSEIDFIGELLEEVGLKAWAIHGSNGKNGVTEVGGGHRETRKDFLSPNEWQRQAGLDLVRNRIALARRIGSANVVMHFDLDDNVMRDPDSKEAYYKVVHQSLDDLRDDCEKTGVRIAIENLFDAPIDHTLEQLDRIFERHPQSVIGLCYDSGHAELAEKGQLRILETFRSRLITTHLNDNRSVRDDHLLPGDGNIDWDRIAALLADSPCQAPFNWETPYLHHGMGYDMGEAAFFHRAYPLIEAFEDAIQTRRARRP